MGRHKEECNATHRMKTQNYERAKQLYERAMELELKHGFTNVIVESHSLREGCSTSMNSIYSASALRLSRILSDQLNDHRAAVETLNKALEIEVSGTDFERDLFECKIDILRRVIQSGLRQQ